MHAFDRWLGRRTLGFTAAATAVAAGVVMLTDEAGSSAAMRVARLAALAPGLAALGGWIALSQAASRGELRALAALGASPWRVGSGVSMAGWLIGAAAVLLLCWKWVDTSALFPVVSSSASWATDKGVFVEPFAGVRVLPDGSFRAVEALRPRPLGAGPGRLEALVAVAPLAAILPVWVVAPLASGGRAAAAALTAMLLILLLHLVGGGHIPAVALALAVVPLVLQVSAAAVVARRACPPREP
jgi:hypothetical protein